MWTWNPWRPIAGLGLALAVTAAGAQEPAPPPPPQFVAFYVPWDPAALASLRAHVREVDVFSPMWGSLVSAKGEVRWEEDPEAHAVLAAAGRRPKVYPLISNAHDDIWDKAAAEAIILQPAAARAFAEALVRRAQADRLDGFVMDFENLTPRATAGYPAFLAALRDRLKAAGREVWVTTTLTPEDGLPADIARDVDAVVLMAYDQCWATSTPGPIAADAWIAANLRSRMAGQDPRRLVVALASYGYDWPAGRKAEVTAIAPLAGLAHASGAAVEHPPGSNAHFGYRDRHGVGHQVWYVGAADFARQRAMVEPLGVRGVALWRMGLEDPGLWSTRAPVPAAPAGPANSCEPLPGR
jgi:spore germination protein YaaH